MTIVICVRDPDCDNEFEVFEGDVRIFNVDLGRGNLNDPDYNREWCKSWQEEIDHLREFDHREPANRLQTIVDEQRSKQYE